MVYDSLVIVALWMISLFVLTGLNHFEAVQGPAVSSLLFLELYAFYAYFWVRGGQTVGMMAWRIEIRTDDGGPFTLTHATLRFIGALLSFACLGLGYLWVLIDPAKRSWSDMLSSTTTLHMPRQPD